MMRVEDFPRDYRFKMVDAYRTISGVPNIYEATHEEIDAGFARCLASTNLRRTHEMKLAEIQAARGDGAPVWVDTPDTADYQAAYEWKQAKPKIVRGDGEQA